MDFADQICGPIVEAKATLVHKKVRMNHDIYMGKHFALYIQNRDQCKPQTQRCDIESCSLKACN